MDLYDHEFGFSLKNLYRQSQDRTPIGKSPSSFLTLFPRSWAVLEFQNNLWGLGTEYRIGLLHRPARLHWLAESIPPLLRSLKPSQTLLCSLHAYKQSPPPLQRHHDHAWGGRKQETRHKILCIYTFKYKVPTAMKSVKDLYVIVQYP
jgi:hypothetical protein